jgi:hypothetical protein
MSGLSAARSSDSKTKAKETFMTTTTADVRITGFNVTDKVSGSGTGDIILGYFAVKAHGISVAGCRLMRANDGKYSIAAPNLTDGGNFRGVRIEDAALKRQILNLACDAYAHFGGGYADEARSRARE